MEHSLLGVSKWLIYFDTATTAVVVNPILAVTLVDHVPAT